MALLLKVMSDRLVDNMTVVPRMKSAKLADDDAGSTVFVWLVDDTAGKSALHAVATLTSFQALTVPQVRDPTKKKDAYRLVLDDIRTQILHPLTVGDLGPYNYVEGADGIESLGRIHRDRNDKIMRLTGAEAAVLEERFTH